MIKRFSNIFSKGNIYFGEWSISYDSSFKSFLDAGLSLKKQELLNKQLGYLSLYLDSLQVLKDKEEVEGDYKTYADVLISRQIWYACVLLFFIGFVDQHTKQEIEIIDGKTKIKSQRTRLKLVIDFLSEKEKRYFVNSYNGGMYKDFDSVINHIYNTRNTFVHEMILTEEKISQDSHIHINTKGDSLIAPNLPFGKILLSIVVALVRFLGFKGEIEVHTDNSFDSMSNLLKKT